MLLSSAVINDDTEKSSAFKESFFMSTFLKASSRVVITGGGTLLTHEYSMKRIKTKIRARPAKILFLLLIVPGNSEFKGIDASSGIYKKFQLIHLAC